MRVYLDGEFIDEALARVALDDAGFLYGEGAFETMRISDGVALDSARHLERLRASLRGLDIDLPDGIEPLAGAVRELASTGPRPHARMRLTVTAGHDGAATRLVTVRPYEPPAAAQRRSGVAVVTARGLRIDSTSPLCGIKSTAYVLQRLAARQAKAASADEALLANERGELVEGSRTNIFVIRDGRAVTPPLSSGCLAGIARARLLEAGLAVECTVRAADLMRAEGLMLSNSLIGLVPVKSVDGHPMRVNEDAARWQHLLESSWQRG